MTDLEVAASSKAILDRSNVMLIYNGILCGTIYQQDSSSRSWDKFSKILITMSLLIITCNRIQYESNFSYGLRTRVQETGPLLPTLCYVIPEFLLIILLILEGFKAGGPISAIAVILLFVVLFGLGSGLAKHMINKDAEVENAGSQLSNV
ncbi:hypothetical protein DL96DRAFT_1681867 [Flagelloscypha sp. PMI_526]|nr:hypothetical protein DL96DRAFT_1681867 [Flagelloscypha sp. PMI_526]